MIRTVSRRAYRSALRSEQAAGTRRLILQAARRVFAERGYAGATIAAIADEADVAVPTIYSSVGGKTAILTALNDMIDAESDVSATIGAIRASTDPAEVVRLAVDVTRRINADFGDVIALFRAAAPTEPEAAAAVEEGLRRHRVGVELTARRLHALGALRPGMTWRRAADELGLLTLWPVWEAAVRYYGWSWDETAAWITATATAAVLSSD
jgi:AcrR family transcriptional regulator